MGLNIGGAITVVQVAIQAHPDLLKKGILAGHRDALVGHAWIGGDKQASDRRRIHGLEAMRLVKRNRRFDVSRPSTDITLRTAFPLIPEESLREDIQRFIGQEATHSQLHRIFNARLKEQGLRNHIEPAATRRIHRMQHQGIRGKLAITMAYEHFTATLGEALLRYPDWLEGASEPMRVLWQWHAVEECEHRAVAADAYRALAGDEGTRIGWFLYVSLLSMADTSFQTFDNLRQSGQLWHWRTWRQGARFLFGGKGLVRAVIPAWFAYLRPGFSPRNHEDDELARRWLATHASPSQ